jgi:hypothetical protein
MAGESDTLDVEAQAPADLDEHNRERYGDTQPSVQDLVEIGIPRVVVIILVPPKWPIGEEPVSQVDSPSQLRIMAGEVGACLSCKIIELVLV